MADLVLWRLVLGGEVEEELLDVPVEERVEVGVEVEGQEAEVVLLAGGRVVGHVLHHHVHSLDVHLKNEMKKYILVNVP